MVGRLHEWLDGLLGSLSVTPMVQKLARASSVAAETVEAAALAKNRVEAELSAAIEAVEAAKKDLEAVQKENMALRADSGRSAGLWEEEVGKLKTAVAAAEAEAKQAKEALDLFRSAEQEQTEFRVAAEEKTKEEHRESLKRVEKEKEEAVAAAEKAKVDALAAAAAEAEAAAEAAAASQIKAVLEETHRLSSVVETAEAKAKEAVEELERSRAEFQGRLKRLEGELSEERATGAERKKQVIAHVGNLNDDKKKLTSQLQRAKVMMQEAKARELKLVEQVSDAAKTAEASESENVAEVTRLRAKLSEVIADAESEAKAHEAEKLKLTHVGAGLAKAHQEAAHHKSKRAVAKNEMIAIARALEAERELRKTVGAHLSQVNPLICVSVKNLGSGCFVRSIVPCATSAIS